MPQTPYSKCFLFQTVVLFLLLFGDCLKQRHDFRNRSKYWLKPLTTPNPYTKTICMQMSNTIRARHKTCFLRPDTGPCRADIVQWYFDVKQLKCYRFFWGGCQGNGNRFETRRECRKYCYLNYTHPPEKIPYFCSLNFDYGRCFGYFNRWGWDTFDKSCKHRIYSGCGGNQNNFETHAECVKTCLNPPNTTLHGSDQFTTCMPFNIDDLQ